MANYPYSINVSIGKTPPFNRGILLIFILTLIVFGIRSKRKQALSPISTVKSQETASQSPRVCSTVIQFLSWGLVPLSILSMSHSLSGRDKWTGPVLHQPLKVRHLQSTIESFSRNSRKDS